MTVPPIKPLSHLKERQMRMSKEEAEVLDYIRQLDQMTGEQLLLEYRSMSKADWAALSHYTSKGAAKRFVLAYLKHELLALASLLPKIIGAIFIALAWAAMIALFAFALLS